MTSQFLSWRSFPASSKSLLQACMKSRSLRPGEQVHAQMITSGIDMDGGTLCSNLIAMYASCGEVQSSNLLLNTVAKPTALAWNWAIMASAFKGDFKESLISYFRMLASGAHPNSFTFSNVLKACVGLLDVDKGRETHCILTVRGFGSDLSAANALIDMYCKCGVIEDARQVFDRMPLRDVISWTSMISGLFSTGSVGEATGHFEQMQLKGTEANGFTWNAMISGYIQHRDSNAALKVFDEMKKRGLGPDHVTWNALISGLVQNDQFIEALGVYRQMVASGVKPNAVCMAGLLPAFGKMGSLKQGRQAHGLIYRGGLQADVFVATALIDMYSKCGSAKLARRVFDGMESRNVASWNAIIGCYGKHGDADASVQLFERMLQAGMEADQSTFTSLLSACSHTGSVGKGLAIFKGIKEVFGVEPSSEHHSCVVDLLCRSGYLEEASEILKAMQVGISRSMLGAFFSGCKCMGGFPWRTDVTKAMEEIDALKYLCKGRVAWFVDIEEVSI